MYIKLLSEISGLHHALVDYLRVWDYRCNEGSFFDTKVTIHAMKQIGTRCELSVEVCKSRRGVKTFHFFNITI